MRDHGGVQKFAQLISWCVSTFSIHTARKATSTHSSGVKSVRTTTPSYDSSLEQSHLREQTSILEVPLRGSPQYVCGKQELLSRGVQSSGGIHAFVYEGTKLRTWNWRVADLCQILLSVLEPVGDTMSFPGGIQGGQEGWGNVYWEHATHLIIDVLLGVFCKLSGRSDQTISPRSYRSDISYICLTSYCFISVVGDSCIHLFSESYPLCCVGILLCPPIYWD